MDRSRSIPAVALCSLLLLSGCDTTPFARPAPPPMRPAAFIPLGLAAGYLNGDVIGGRKSRAAKLRAETGPADRLRLRRGRAGRRGVAPAGNPGPALRRLRIQRGLRQSDFGSVTGKTIARIERGEIMSPQARTLEAVAKRLAVAPEELQTF